MDLVHAALQREGQKDILNGVVGAGKIHKRVRMPDLVVNKKYDNCQPFSTGAGRYDVLETRDSLISAPNTDPGDLQYHALMQSLIRQMIRGEI